MFDILLIDDETHITASIKKTIPWHEIEVEHVFEASNAEDAIRILEQNEIDIVLSDIKMPSMNGLDLIEHLQLKWPHIKYILLTGYADFQYAQRAIKLKAMDYLLKPVKDEELIFTISSTIDVLKDEWKEGDKVNQLSYNLKSNYQVLISNLFHDILLGRMMSNSQFIEKLKQYESTLNADEDTIILLFQLNEHQYDETTLQLMEYAVANIATEIFTSYFHVLYTTTPHYGAMLILQFVNQTSLHITLTEIQKQMLMKEKIELLHQNVNSYLKMKLTIVVSDLFTFPDQLANEYRSSLSTIYAIPQEHGITYRSDIQNHSKQQRIFALDSLYKPPTFINLLESKQWDTAKMKLDEIFNELKQNCTMENLYEVYFSVTNTFLYVAHKQGQVLTQIDQLNYDLLIDRRLLNSVDKLKEWTSSILSSLQDNLSESDQYSRKYIINKVQSIVANRMNEDVSLKSIADIVNLHPVYLSKIYKMETGEGLSDYIIRTKMERAMYMLKNGNKKIYEITEELGYLNPQSFRKMFRKYFNMSPNEFRDS